MNEKAKSCWSCHYSQVGGNVFPCGCKWFMEHGKATVVKDVPSIMVDAGCKLWKQKLSTESSVE